MVDLAEGFLVCLHSSLGGVLFLVDRVLEVARETLNLLDLLLQIASQACQLHDDFVFEVSSFVRLSYSLLVEVTQDVSSITNAATCEEV